MRAQERMAHSVAVTDSALAGASAVTVDARARKAQKVARISAAGVVIVFTAVAFTLHGKTDSGRSEFHIEDQIAMVLLGLVAAAGILMFTRPRIIADRDGVRVRNLLAWKYFSWDMIAAVRFDRGSPWVALDLHDDDVISVMAVQAADKEYAVETVRTLRRLLAASEQRRGEPAGDSSSGASGVVGGVGDIPVRDSALRDIDAEHDMGAGNSAAGGITAPRNGAAAGGARA